jgi:hypothetical protein
MQKCGRWAESGSFEVYGGTDWDAKIGSVVTKMKFMEVRIRMQNIGSVVTKMKFTEVRIRMQNTGSVVTKMNLKFGLHQCL